MEEVSLHSATRLFAKSILVYTPRLPMIRETGSQFF
jgi:hypothetical protein